MQGTRRDARPDESRLPARGWEGRVAMVAVERGGTYPMKSPCSMVKSQFDSVDAVYESRSSILLCLMVFGHKRNAMGQSKGWFADLICLSCHISSNRWFMVVHLSYGYLPLVILQTMVFFLGLNSSRVVTSALPAPGIRHLLLLPGGHQLRSPAHLRSSRRGTKKLLVYHGENHQNHQKDRCNSLTLNLGFAVWKKFTYV